jgi:hypothetical protein
MAATQTAERRSGRPSELGRYAIAEGERVLVGQRVDGVVQVTDRPLGRPGRSYLVESGISSMGSSRRSSPTTRRGPGSWASARCGSR